MTAVAPPPNLQPISRTGWNAGNGTPNGFNSIGSDDVGRMFMPRKSAQRSNSSSSLSSQASTASTVSNSNQSISQLNGASSTLSDSGWGPRKKPTRSLWPASKPDLMSGLSNVRPQSLPPSSAGPSAAQSAISSLHAPNSMLPSQHGVQSQMQQNGATRQQPQSEPQAILHLLPMNGTFERKTISVPFYPDVVRIGRQTNAKTLPTPVNGYFDSKVLSRQHAEVWADRSGKIWIRDIKSSNGTFVNGQRLSQENRDSDPHELREQDMLELGIDIVSEDQKTVVHHKVAARVEHAGIYANSANFMDMNLGDLDPSSSGGLISSSMQMMGPMRGRTGSAGSMGSNGRLSAPNSVAGSHANANANAMSHQRTVNFWLTPVTMEQIVKRLNTELKQAQRQSMELSRTTHYMNTLLTNEQKEDEPRVLRSKASPLKLEGAKARFSDPPAPPPQHPLPEKPDTARAPSEPPVRKLGRSDTERPKLVTHNTVPIQTDTSHQISSLVDALSTAKNELDSQNLRLKDLEIKLEQEREKRECAESRAQRLESLASVDSPLLPRQFFDLPHPNNFPLAAADNSTHTIGNNFNGTSLATSMEDSAMATRLQRRLELMVKEMEEMRLQMDQYRRRAEAAEEASAEDRRSLAEMVEKIRKERPERGGRDGRRRGGKMRSRSRSTPANGTPAVVASHTNIQGDHSVESRDNLHIGNGETITRRKKGVAGSPSEPHNLVFGQEHDRAVAWLQKTGILPGQTVTADQISSLEKMVDQALAMHSYSTGNKISTARRKDDVKGALARLPATDMVAFNNAAPFASMLGVVIVGVGLMAWLNGWQRVER